MNVLARAVKFRIRWWLVILDIRRRVVEGRLRRSHPQSDGVIRTGFKFRGDLRGNLQLSETALMRKMLRACIGGILCLAMAGGAAVVLVDPKGSAAIEGAVRWGWSRLPSFSAGPKSPHPGRTPRSGDPFPLFSTGGFENAGYPTASRYTGPIADRGSLEQIKAAMKGRGRRGIDELRSKLSSIPPDSADGPFLAFQIQATLALLSMYEGSFDEAALWTEKALAGSTSTGMPAGLRANLEALLGVIHLRRGETENCLECLGPSSCIFPIAADAVHQRPSGSREAIRHFRAVPRPAAGGPRRALAVERRPYDPGRVSRHGPAGTVDPARAISLAP